MQEYLIDFIESCKEVVYKESCGVVVLVDNVLKYIKCTNLSEDPHNFIIDPMDYMRAEKLGEIKFICHSHLGTNAYPSEADKYSCNKGKVPWIIYALKSNTLYTFNPNEFHIPLIGRPYSFGTMDCWSLVSDLYMQDLGIHVGRPIVTSEEWFEHKDNLFENHAEENGFIKVDYSKTLKYDVLLFKVANSRVPNHSGVVYDDPYFIHHVKDRLSNKERFGGYWLKHLYAVYRHKELL